MAVKWPHVRGKKVRAFGRLDGGDDVTKYIGPVVEYSDLPMVRIEMAVGPDVWWRADLCDYLPQEGEQIKAPGIFSRGVVVATFKDLDVHYVVARATTGDYETVPSGRVMPLEDN